MGPKKAPTPFHIGKNERKASPSVAGKIYTSLLMDFNETRLREYDSSVTTNRKNVASNPMTTFPRVCGHY